MRFVRLPLSRLLVLVVTLVVVVVVGTTSSIASAATSPADAALAQALFTSGKDAMARGDLATACARFTESYKLDPGVGTLLNLATCEDRSGKLAIALEHFTSARTQLPKDDFRIGFANERITSLTQRVARIIVRGAPSSSRVLRDGAEVESSVLSVGILVDPGAHVVVLEMPGQPAERTEMTLREGEERIIEPHSKKTTAGTTPIPAPAPTNEKDNAATTTTAKKNPATAEPDDKGSGADQGKNPRKTLAFVTGGIAVSAFTVGAVTGLMTVNAASTYRAHCTNGECDPDGLAAADTGRTMRVVSPVSFVVGAVFGVASAYFFITAPSSSKKSAALARRHRLLEHAPKPFFIPSGGGIAIAGAL